MHEENTHENLDGCGVDITENDIYQAMKDIPGYLDVTPQDLKEIYKYAFRHAVQRLTRSTKAKDVMTKEVIFVGPETLLHEVAKTMAKHGVSGAPVVDSGRVVGIISQKDFLALIAPDDAKSLMGVLADCIKRRGCAGSSLRDRTVREVMSSPAVTLHEDVTLAEIVEIFASKHINRAPVIDHEGRMIGIVSRDDVLKAYSGEHHAVH
jgi:CBS domain-containing membrane protein